VLFRSPQELLTPPRSLLWYRSHRTGSAPMQLNTNPFEWLGQAFGTLVRLIVDGLAWIFDILGGASTAFVNGFSRALGIDSSILSIAFVVLGLFLIYLGISS